MNSPSQRVLVVTGTLPGERGVGEIILRDLVAATTDIDLGFFGVLPKGADCARFSANGTNLVGTAEKRFETAFRPVRGAFGEVTSAVALRTLFRQQVSRIVTKAVAMGRRFHPEFVWGILDCPTTIFASVEVARKLGVPHRVLVWDDPELLASQLNYDRFSRQALVTQFGKVLSSAERVAVVGETMQAIYRDRHGCDSLIMRHGLAPETWKAVGETRTRSGPFIIGYAGSLTAPDAFDTLIQTLDARDWKIDGREVVLRLAGVRYLLNPCGPRRIDYFGWRTVAETVNLLAESDLLYLAQPFSKALRPLAELSFPTKLSTYLAAGRPILLHAPEYASLVPFLERFPCGARCLTLDQNELGRHLTDLATDDSARARAETPITLARETELNANRFISSFRQLMGTNAQISPRPTVPPVESPRATRNEGPLRPKTDGLTNSRKVFS